MTKTVVEAPVVVIHAGDDVRLQKHNGYAMHYVRGTALNNISTDANVPHLHLKEKWGAFVSVVIDLRWWTPTVMKCPHENESN